jgi:hypothetical protein
MVGGPQKWGSLGVGILTSTLAFLLRYVISLMDYRAKNPVPHFKTSPPGTIIAPV